MLRQLLRVPNRPQLALRVPARQPAAITAAYTTSAPPKAEEASAQSGGSRSGEAAAAQVPDALAEGSVRGRTGGGEPLASSQNAPPRPKTNNASVPGQGEGLTKEQQQEVDEHNRDFEKKHDRAQAAAHDKVDKDFWSGGGRR